MSDELKPCPADIDEALAFVDSGTSTGGQTTHRTLKMLAEEVRRLRTQPDDTRMLDWLDEVNRDANIRNGTEYGWRFDINHNRAALTDHNLPALDVRAAIQKAMAQQQNTP